MNRKLALYRHEMRTMIWFMLGGVLAALFFCYIMNQALADRCLPYFDEVSRGIGMMNESVSFTSILSLCTEHASLVGILALTLMGIVQFGDLHKRKSQEYLNSLPFTKRERFVVKVVIGYIALAVTMLVTIIGVLIVRGRFIGIIQKNALLSPSYKVLLGNDTLWHAVSMLLVMWLALCAVYAIIVLVHAIVNRSVLGGIIAVGVIMAPMWFYGVATMLMQEWHFLQDRAGEAWYQYSHYLGALAGQPNTNVNYMRDSVDGPILYYDNFWILTAIYVVIILTCLAIAIFTSGRTDLSRGGMLVEKYPARIFLSAGIGLCFGTGISILLSFWFLNEIEPASFIIGSAITAALIYVLCTKLFRKVFG